MANNDREPVYWNINGWWWQRVEGTSAAETKSVAEVLAADGDPYVARNIACSD